MRLDHPEGRKGWSLIALTGGGMVFTVFAAYGLFALANHVEYIFWLTVMAHFHIFMIFGAQAFVLGRRIVISITRDGILKNDSGDED